MDPLKTGAQRTPRWEERLMVACMAGLVVITLLNVVTRYLTDDSFAWTEEFSVALMVVMTLAGASAVAFRDRHIRIEFFFNRKSVLGIGEPRPGLQRGGLILSGVFFVVLAVLFTRLVWDQIRFAETSMGLGIPLWWYSAVIPVICPVIAWRCFARLRRLSGPP